jgi:hypothetical protein
MCSAHVSASDPSAGLSGLPWRVVEVRALAGYRLAVRFADSTRGEVDMARLIESDRAGVFKSLQDVGVFERVHVEQGAVTWPGDIDLAPDAMYAAIKARGSCELS